MPRPRDEYNPFAAPKSDLSPDEYVEDGEREVRYASFWNRFVASIVDGFLVSILQFGVGAVFGLVLAPQNAEDVQDWELALRLVGLVIFWLYYTIQESSSAQATLGKRAVDIRVMSEYGEQVGFGRATARFLGRLVFMVPIIIGGFLGPVIGGVFAFIGVVIVLADFLIQPFTPRRQTLHDMIAGVVVVKR